MVANLMSATLLVVSKFWGQRIHLGAAAYDTMHNRNMIAVLT